MKKIDFKTLHFLVCNVDYFGDNSYPIVFEVHNKNKKPIKYECGLTSLYLDSSKEFCDLIFNAVGCEEEIQYLYNIDRCEFLDLQDCDCMASDEIKEMLKKKCKINEDSVIFFDEKESFNDTFYAGEIYSYYDEDENAVEECFLSDDLVKELRCKYNHYLIESKEYDERQS